MSDRSSAACFGFFFELLAESPTDKHKEMACKVWKESQKYDFAAQQLECDDALIALGLAVRVVHPKYPQDGEQTRYMNAMCTNWAPWDY